MSNRLKNIYEKITQDTTIKDIYDKAEKCNNNMWALHGLQHIKNVDKRVEDVLKKLNYSSDTIYKAKICAYLHDTGAISGKDGHARRSAKFCEEYLNQYDLTQSEKDEIIFAVLNHGQFVETGNIILAVLVFSDKLDIDKTRVSDSGYEIEEELIFLALFF